MKYQVIFKGPSSNAVDVGTNSIGSDGVKKIRGVFGKEFPLENIECISDSLSENVVIDVPEKTAEKLNAFKHDSSVYVDVHQGRLNEYVSEVVYAKRNGYNGCAEEAQLKPELNIVGVLEDWIEQGCPFNWH